MKVDRAVAPSRRGPGQIRPSRGRTGATRQQETPATPLAFTIQGGEHERHATPRTKATASADRAHVYSPSRLTSPGPFERVENNSQQNRDYLSAKLDLAAIQPLHRVSAGDVERGQPCRRFQPG